MLHYPKIPDSRRAPIGSRCIAFEKIDGTNLHFDWDADFGWHAFGTRRDAFNTTPGGIAAFETAHPNLIGCPARFEATLAEGVATVLRARGARAATAFAEFVGPNSFAGQHRADDPKELVLFDVRIEPHGLLGPDAFVAAFGHLRIPRVVYRGKLTGAFTEDVRRGRYDVAEGVVCKGGTGGSDLWMAKIKTNAYRERLRQAFADNWDDFWE